MHAFKWSIPETFGQKKNQKISRDDSDIAAQCVHQHQWSDCQLASTSSTAIVHNSQGHLLLICHNKVTKLLQNNSKKECEHSNGVHSCGYAHKDALVTCIILAATQPKFYTRHKIINTPWIFDSEKAKNLPLSRLCNPDHTLVHTIIDPSGFDVRAMVHAFFITLTCLLRHDKVSKNVLML